MRGRLAGVMVAGALLLHSGLARAQTPEDTAAIQGVITGQIEAFRHDDAPGAFGFAAPNIQQMFHDPDNFIAMVKRGYPAIYRPQLFRFRDTGTSADGQVFQHVTVQGTDGTVYLATYLMERGADGVWRISACLLEQPPAADT